MEKISILIVDDQKLVRSGIRSLIVDQPDMQVLDEASNGEEAIVKAKQLKPDVILMDIAMPGMDGIEATQQIKKETPDTNILVLTGYDDDEFFYPALKAGASGYIVKGIDPEELFVAVRTTAEGNVFLSPVVAGRILGEWLNVKNMSEEAVYQSLSTREKEVMKLMADGYTTRDIASELFLSMRTIEKHRQSMMRKLNLSTTSEVISYVKKTDSGNS